MAERITYGGNYREGADEKLIDILTRAASAQGMQVEFTSGYRPGDKRQHGKKNALDITLIKDGQRLPNYQNAEHFRTYEKFAQTARQIQRAQYPELDSKFRWGGYFSGPKGKYGAMDTMHFDLAGDRLGMGGGSWERGLTKQQRNLFPGVVSVGFNDHPMPKANIPDSGVASAYADTRTPQPAVISASLGSARSNPPPLPTRRPTPATPSANYDRDWLNDYSRVIGQHQPQRPTGVASLSPQPSRSMVNDAVASFRPLPTAARPPAGMGGIPGREFSGFTAPQPAGGVPLRRVASVPVSGNSMAGMPMQYWPQRGEANEQRQMTPPRVASPPPAPQQDWLADYNRVLAANQPIPRTASLQPPTAPRPAPPPPAQPAPLPMPHTGAVKARANNQMAALPMTEAEQLFQASQFGMPQVAPIPMPFGARPGMQAPQPMGYGMRPQLPPMPRPRPSSPLQIMVGGGQRAPQPRPAHEAAIARNGYVYAPNPSGGRPVQVGSSRPAGMSPGEDYDRRAAAARASAGSSGSPFW